MLHTYMKQLFTLLEIVQIFPLIVEGMRRGETGGGNKTTFRLHFGQPLLQFEAALTQFLPIFLLVSLHYLV